MRLVRLAFHDSVGVMDGFVNLLDTENNGLMPAIIMLDDMYYNLALPSSGLSIQNVVSKADFYAWTYAVAVEFCAERQNRNNIFEPGIDLLPTLSVRYGRETYEAEDSADEGPEESFPTQGAHSGHNELFDYFHRKFGFTPREATALMGAHGLGGAERAFSGFAGVWTTQKTVLDTVFFNRIKQIVDLQCDASGENCQNIVDGLDFPCSASGSDESSLDWRCHGWEQVVRRVGADRKVQWRHGCSFTADGGRADCAGLMLNVDISLFYDIDQFLCTPTQITNGECVEGQIGSVPADSICTTDRIFASCFDTTTETSADVEEFSDDLDNWMLEFSGVYDMILQNVPPGVTLQTLEEGTESPSSAPSSAPTNVPGVTLNQPCPQECQWTNAVPPTPNPYQCDGCDTGFCAFLPARRQQPAGSVCKRENFTPRTPNRSLRYINE
jgi:hypothetical protein